MRSSILLSILTLFVLGACSVDVAENPLVDDVESRLTTLTRDTATLVRQPGPNLFVEAHSDSTGYRRIRVSIRGTLNRSRATAYFDDRTRARYVETTWFGTNGEGAPDGDRIEEIAAMVFGTPE